MRKLALIILVLLMIGISPVVSWAGDKILPIDYTEADKNSREIWFEYTDHNHCLGVVSFRRGKNTDMKIMRSGNVLATVHVLEKTGEFLSMEVKPKNSLVAVSGINGLKFGKALNFEFTQDINYVKLTLLTL